MGSIGLTWRHATAGMVAASLGLFATLVASPVAAQVAPQPPTTSATFTTVEARDGIDLSICIHMPAGDGPFPTILEWTGYTISDTTTFPPGGCPPQFPALRDRLVPEGYVFIAGNPRGVGASEGEQWDWWSDQDGRDGADVVDWIADQPWSNGNVGLVGCSGSAMSGIFVAAEAPEPLKAAGFACWTADAYRGAQYPGGVLAWTWQVLAGRPLHDLGPLATSDQVSRGDLTFATRPIAPVDLWLDIHSHATDDEFWEPRSVLDRLANFPPTYSFGSWMDFFGLGATELARLARPEDRHLLQPGGHGSNLNVTGDTEMIERLAGFFDHHLRGAPDPYADEPPILWWETVAGDNFFQGGDLEGRYHGSDQWPPAGIQAQSWWFDAGRTNSQVSVNDGWLRSEPSAEEGSDAFTYPAASPGSVHDVRQTFVGANYDLGIEAAGGAVTYTSEPLAAPLRIAGPITASFWATSTAPDTDWVVRLIDVPPEEQPLDITNGWLKATHRTLDEARTERLDGEIIRPWHTHTDPLEMPVLEPVEYHVELWETATEIPAGHRLKVSISSQEAYWFTQKIPPAVNTILRGPEHPSRIVLPVLTGAGEPVVPVTPPPAAGGQGSEGTMPATGGGLGALGLLVLVSWWAARTRSPRAGQARWAQPAP